MAECRIRNSGRGDVLFYPLGDPQMRHTSFDPAVGKPVAYAIWEDGKLLDSGKTFHSDEVHGVIVGSRFVFIEDQFFGKNPKTLKDLAHEVGKIMGCCEYARIPYIMVAPTTWQSKMGLLNRKPKGISQYNWKKMKEKMIIETAQGICYRKVKDVDEAAAILIGYAMGENREIRNELQFG